jgi:hypothetical protein
MPGGVRQQVGGLPAGQPCPGRLPAARILAERQDDAAELDQGPQGRLGAAVEGGGRGVPLLQQLRVRLDPLQGRIVQRGPTRAHRPSSRARRGAPRTAVSPFLAANLPIVAM